MAVLFWSLLLIKLVAKIKSDLSYGEFGARLLYAVIS